MTDIPSNLMQKGHTTGVVPYSRKKKCKFYTDL